jgi:transcriptional regulator with XRE-family HTH domain
MDIAENIRRLLKSKNLTNKEFCQVLQISENGFKKMLDSNSYKYEILKKIALNLDVPVWELTGDYPSALPAQSIIDAGNAWSKDVNRLMKENEALKKSREALEKLVYAYELQIQAYKALHGLSTTPNTSQP